MNKPTIEVPPPRFATSLILDIFTVCKERGGIDLATGIPTTPADPEAVDGAVHAIRAGHNVYAPSWGLPELRAAIADKLARASGLRYDPATEILVTNGISGGFAAAMMALFTRGDEVIVPEPFFGFHVKLLRLAGLTPRYLRLEAPGYSFDRAQLDALAGPRTRGMILCTPANPCGKVYSEAELELLADFARERDLLIITDEQYEAFCYDGGRHVAPASVADLRERTVTLQGFSKSLSVTGWRQAYAAGPTHMIEAVHCIHQAMYLCPPTPLQHGVLRSLRHPGERVEAQRKGFERKRDQLARALTKAGFELSPSAGGFFLMADASNLTKFPGEDLAMRLLDEIGVAAVPGRAFYSDRSMDHMLRFCFAKRDDEIDEACRRLKRLAQAADSGVHRRLDFRVESDGAGAGDGLRPLTSEADRAAASRLAYEVYVKEFGILEHLANHDQGMLQTDDEGAYTLGVFEGGELVGCFSSFCWADAPFPEFHQRVLEVDRFTAVSPPERWAVLSRLLVKPAQRGSMVPMRLFVAMTLHLLQTRGIDLMFADCQPHLLRLYQSLGLRAYGHPFDYGESGLGIPIIGSARDHDHLRRVRSPMLPILDPSSHDPAHAAALNQVLAGHDPTCSNSNRPERYWEAIATMMEGRAEDLPDPFYGFSTEELRRVLAKGYVLECARGIKLITRGHNTRTVFLIIDGELEAQFTGGSRVMTTGALMGEVAFLTESRRTADVFVRSERARVLCLGERTARGLIVGEPELAGRFLGNLSRILARRLGTR